MRRFIAYLYHLFFPRFRRDYLKRKIKMTRSATILASGKLNAGKYIYIGPRCYINAEGGVTIGDGSILAPEVVILSISHDYKVPAILPYDVYDVHRPVHVGAGVWIGYRALVCPGVTIGDGAIVAMGAVVTKDVMPGDVVGGNPARVISRRNNQDFAKLVSEKAYFHRKYWEDTRVRIKS